MTRILAIAWALSDRKGGGEALGATHLVRHLAEAGVNVDVVTPHVDLAAELPDGVRVRHEKGEATWGNTGPNKFAMVRGVKRALREHDYDAVHVVSQFTSFPVLARPFVMSGCWTFPLPQDLMPRTGRSKLSMAFARRGPRFVRDVPYALWWERAQGWNLARTLREADCVIVRQSKGLDAYPEARRVEHIPFGIDPDRFRAPRDPEPGSILFVGHLTRGKGADTLIRAFRDVHAAVPGARLRLAGAGPEEAALRALAHGLGVADRVEFLGHVPNPEIPRLLARSSVFALPSRWESFAQAALEALAAGVPAVTSANVSGAHDFIEEGVNGHLVDPSDADALAARLRALLEDPERARRMGEAGRVTAARFAWPVIAERHAALYADLAGHARDA